MNVILVLFVSINLVYYILAKSMLRDLIDISNTKTIFFFYFQPNIIIKDKEIKPVKLFGSSNLDIFSKLLARPEDVN